MYDDTFVNECDEIITSMNTEDMVHAHKFVNMVVKTTKKYPLLFLPTFIEDFINGTFSIKIIKKYDLLDFNNFSMLLTSFGLKSKRIKDPNNNNKEKNLQDSKQYSQYQFFSKYANMLNKPLENLLNYNILQTIVSFSILKNTYIADRNIQDLVIEAYNSINSKIVILSDQDKRDSFEKYLNDNVHIKINDIILDLNEKGFVITREGDVSLSPKYSKINEYIHELVKNEKDGISYSSFQRRLRKEFPLLRLASNTSIFDNILDELESRNNIVRKKAFWKYSPNNDQLFTTENYNVKIEQIKLNVLHAGRTKFFGRNVTPDQFIMELKSMEIGDLDDIDDQVTRIAGLVLSDAAVLRSTREDLQEFDFIIDLTNYNFRPAQKEIMKRLDFQVTSNIFHCKVMIDDKVTVDVISSLRNIVPVGEQGVIFTCESVEDDVLNMVKIDRKIQIIEENGIRDWCKITPIIPCRRNSVAKVMYGDIGGKIVRVKSLNYESGLATVETIPGNIENMLSIGCLREISPNVYDPVDFDTASEKYYDFLYRLADSSSTCFDDGMNTPIVAVHNSYKDLLVHTKPELFDNKHPKFNVSTKQESTKYVEFANDIHVKIDLKPKNSFICTCGHRLNEEYNYTLCKHLVSAINRLCQGELSDWDTMRLRIDKVTQKLANFEKENLKRITLAIQSTLEPESRSLIRQYVDTYANCHHGQ